MANTAKEMLRQIVWFLNHSGEEAKMLWDILTALRGPDNGDRGVKRLTTSEIRRRIGLDYWDLSISSYADLPPTPEEVTAALKDTAPHFIAHYRNAEGRLKYLGL